ncbi:MAG: ribosomal protein [Mucilaginibacter sp.]|uniref:four helix bundle protein n=1 Tax=Mucilaginibacter sp. TaxID=1882438 RepID=UPI00260FFFCE|nr:four helix bundle protein [Mucilaginibacter sp.]MDB5002160.1 ribosomal protein [Mucilaginibacter sp.]
MQDFKKLLVWQKSIQLVINTYKATSTFPSEERFGLTNQIRRAVISISNNIAEGCGRFSQKDLVHFLQVSLGSTNEIENCLIISQALDFMAEEVFNNLNSQNTEVRKMLISLIEKIRKEK